jgi:hypothetical protein
MTIGILAQLQSAELEGVISSAIIVLILSVQLFCIQITHEQTVSPQ